MLKDSAFNRIFIRLAILLLRSVSPLSVAYCVFVAVIRPPPPRRLPWPVELWLLAETVFYFVVYLPRSWWLNLPARSGPVVPRGEREELFERTWEVTPDPHGYISLWFKGAPPEALRREDVKDWLAWRFLNKFHGDVEDDEELEHYLKRTEEVLGIKFLPGHGQHTSMRVTIEPVRMQHRPLLYYVFMVGGADFQFSFFMLYCGYQFYALPLARMFTSLPLRPLAWFSRHRSPVEHLSYWHLPHTSKDHIPVLFIHGVGVGLHYYLGFFVQFLRATKQLNGGQIGLIALEIMPISARITHTTLDWEQMCMEIYRILSKHNYSRCILMTHSYGSVVGTHLLRHRKTSGMIGPLLLIDPVAFSFHPPEVAWNFLRRNPTTASEMQLQYFASMDAGIAHALTRRFLWLENSLWREDIEGRPDGRCTVVLSSDDIITDTKTLGRYLTRPSGINAAQDKDRCDDWKRSEWTGKGLEVLWFETLNHAEVFDTESDRGMLIRVLMQYSTVK